MGYHHLWKPPNGGKVMTNAGWYGGVSQKEGTERICNQPYVEVWIENGTMGWWEMMEAKGLEWPGEALM